MSPLLVRIARGALILLLALAAFVVVIKTFSERPDDCLCVDGTQLGGWTQGWTSPEGHCAALCRAHGTGRPLTPEESEAKQASLRAARAGDTGVPDHVR